MKLRLIINKQKINNTDVFKVEKAQLKKSDGTYITRHFITKNKIPDYLVNDFLLYKSLNSPLTAKTYAYSLVKYFNFLSSININYLDATRYFVKQYIKFLIFGDDDIVVNNENTITYSTISLDIVVINEFYKFLKREQEDILLNMQMKYVRKKARKRLFLYGQIYDYNYMEKIVDLNIKNLKSSKEYYKWYEEDQIVVILSNFNSLRDEAVFLLSLEGMRIDEILSLKLQGIDEDERTVQPTRSKGKQSSENYGDTNNDIRIVSIPKSSFDVLQKYIQTERFEAESESGIYDDYVFINLRKGKSQGKPLSYHNYLKILKNVAKRAGLDDNKIKTHNGRSTKVNQLQEHRVLHPEDNITDEIIKEIMGWKSIDSIEPYKNRKNKVIAKAASEKIYSTNKEPKEIQKDYEDKKSDK